MKNNIYFHEVQRFNQWWFWLIWILVFAIMISAIIFSSDNEKTSYVGIILVLIIALAMFTVRLKTIINEDGVYIRYFPFHLKYKRFLWDEIEEVYIRKYRPMLEFGGWGLRLGIGRLGIGRKNIAYNVRGNIGLQLVLKNGKKVLIGTMQADAMQQILSKIKQQNVKRI